MKLLSLGLMSGTSMDGIDVALLETDGKTHLVPKAHHYLPYPAHVKIALKDAERAFHAAKGRLNLPDVVALSTEWHIQAIEEFLQKFPNHIDVIGYHGQTMFHQPVEKISVQLGDAALLAKRMRIKVVHDFRRQDIAAGGQGAPLAPIYHQALAVRDKKIPLAVVNCGGIANVSFVLGETPEMLFGFDTGPGNTFIDAVVTTRTHDRETMDENGQYGLRGKINTVILESLFQQNERYFLKKPPKSLDVRDLVLPVELETLSLEDACATLEAFTAEAIVRSVDCLDLEKKYIPQRWILAGGGWKNPVILRELRMRLEKKLGKNVRVQHADAIGWNNAALEAELIAYLAVRSLEGLPLSFPNTTGVLTPCGGGDPVPFPS